MGKHRMKPNYRRRTLRLPDLDHCKTAVLNSLGLTASRRVYEYAIDQFEIVTKRVEGEVDYNDGEFAEVRTVGIEGIENGLWLGTMQIHRAKTEYTPDELRERYPVGMRLHINYGNLVVYLRINRLEPSGGWF